MKHLSNVHTHTNFCDGADTAEDMVKAAIRAGYETLGFSGHENTPFDESWCMTADATKEYLAEIKRLKQKYSSEINVLLGIERDYYSAVTCDDEGEPFPFDYVIGSVHYMKVGNEYIPVDESKEILVDAVERCFDGDVYKMTDAYFALVADVVEKTGADIIGHFDLITKFNDGELFDETNDRYVQSALAAVRRLVPYGKPFEVNVGAVTRGYRSVPYPAKFILEEICRLGGEVIVTGDCHDVASLEAGFGDVYQLIEECGFTGFQNL